MKVHRDKVAVGDRVFFYLSGPEAGIYVVGRVVSPVYAAPEEDEFGRWKVDVEYDAFVEPPLLRAGLTDPTSEPVLADWAPFRGLQGTNFLVPEAVAARLDQLLAGRLRAIPMRISLNWPRQSARNGHPGSGYWPPPRRPRQRPTRGVGVIP